MYVMYVDYWMPLVMFMGREEGQEGKVIGGSHLL